MITCTQRKLIIVYVFRTETIINLLQLFLESTRCITETLEDTTDGRNIIIFSQHSILIFSRILTLFLLRNRRNEELIGIGSQGDTVVLIDRNHQGCSQTEIGRQELAIFLTAESNLATDIGDIKTHTQLAFTLTDNHIVLIIGSNIGSKG